MTDQHTKQDYAEQIRWLVEEAYPDAEYIRVVHEYNDPEKSDDRDEDTKGQIG